MAKENISAVISMYLAEPNHAGRIRVMALIDAVMERALSGDVKAAELLVKYAYGTPLPMKSEEENAPRQIVVNLTLSDEC
jgi:hypothetical protein